MKPFLGIRMHITCTINYHTSKEVFAWFLSEQFYQQHHKISACF